MFSAPFRSSARILTAILLAGCLTPLGAAQAQGLPAPLLPDGTAAAAFFPVADILAAPGFQAVRAKLADRGAQLDKPLNPKAKLTLADLESVLVAADGTGKNYVMIVTLREDSNEENFNVDTNDKSETVGDYDLYEIGGERAACLVDGRTLLLGPTDTVRTIMRRPGDAEISAELASAWSDAGQKPAFGAALGTMIGKQAGAMLPAALPVGDVFAKIENVTATFDVADPLAVNVTIRCADASAAMQLKGLADAFSALAMTQAAGDKVLVQTAQTSVAGSTLSVRATLDAAGVFRMLDAALVGGEAQ
jgi:hypothetical protein